MTNTSYSYKEIYPSVVLTSDDIRSSKHSVNDASSGCCDGCASTDGIEEIYIRTDNMHNIKAFVIQAGRILLMYVLELRIHRRDVYATLVLLSPSLSSASKACQSNPLFVSCCFIEGGRCVYIYIYISEPRLSTVYIRCIYFFSWTLVLSCSFVSKNEVGQLWFVLE